MRIFDFTDYKTFIIKKIKMYPKNGRGQISRIAKQLIIHTTMVTHILKGKAQLSNEQSLKLAEYFLLSELETDYLLLLVQFDRASDKKTKSYFMDKIRILRDEALKVSTRISVVNQLNESDRSFYYSMVYYSLIRLLTAIQRFQTLESLSEELQWPISKLKVYLDFLVSRGLCLQENNIYKYGSTSTYIEPSSPLVNRHHLNWRHKAQEFFDRLDKEDLLFTMPVVLDREGALKIRDILSTSIESIKKIADPAPSEELYILNIDWLKISSLK